MDNGKCLEYGKRSKDKLFSFDLVFDECIGRTFDLACFRKNFVGRSEIPIVFCGISDGVCWIFLWNYILIQSRINIKGNYSGTICIRNTNRRACT